MDGSLGYQGCIYISSLSRAWSHEVRIGALKFVNSGPMLHFSQVVFVFFFVKDRIDG